MNIPPVSFQTTHEKRQKKIPDIKFYELLSFKGFSLFLKTAKQLLWFWRRRRFSNKIEKIVRVSVWVCVSVCECVWVSVCVCARENIIYEWAICQDWLHVPLAQTHTHTHTNTHTHTHTHTHMALCKQSTPFKIIKF